MPYPMPPRKKRTSSLVVLGIVGGLVLLCGVGGALSGGKNGDAHSATNPTVPAAAAVAGSAQPSEPAGSPAPAPTNPPTPGIGTPVRDGTFEFTVTLVQSGQKTIGDNPYLSRTAQGMYTIVSLTVRNISDRPHGFSPGDQYVFDARNRKFGNDATAAMNLQADTSLYADVNPGNTITAQVVFDLPADSAADHIVLHDSMFSGGVTVALH
jgi:hypothetical protein